MISKAALSTLAISLLPLAARAHIALWDPAMFGWNDDPNQQNAVEPLAQLEFNDWFLHGEAFRNTPPKAGVFMELPSNGVYHGYTSCNKAQSKYSTEATERDATIYACKSSTSNPADGRGAMHTIDEWATPNPTNVKGTSIAIAYKSDIHQVQPEDFAVISVNYTSPWFQQTDYRIPGDLPACPEGGCLCMWSWVHSVEGGSEQIYQLAYRCKVTGATGTRALPAPQVAKKCHFPTDTSNCTIGAKQPHYWLQKERNNNFQDYYDPPFYNGNYGFMDGAQTDLFAGVVAVEPIPAASSSSAAILPTTSVAPSKSSSSSEVPASMATTYTTVYRPASSSSAVGNATSLDPSSAMPTGVHNVPNATTTNSTASVASTSASIISGSSAPQANSSKPTGKTCRRLPKRYLVRRMRKHPRISKEKRMFSRPPIPEIRIGVVTDSAPAEPARESDPVRRRAAEAAGLDGMRLARELRVSQLRGGRSVRF